RPAGVTADGAAGVARVVVTAEATGAVVGQAEVAGAVLTGPLVVLAAVVRVEALLLLGGQLAVGVDLRRVLDLVLGDVDAQLAITARRGAGERHEARLHPEQAGLDRGPLRLAAGAVEVDVVDGADLVAGAVDHGGTA